MLVLTRKLNEQILIGDDITITLTRVAGNTVRLGIDAPREVRIVRGELALREEALDSMPGGGPQISRREEAFAHPSESDGTPVATQPVATQPVATQPVAAQRVKRPTKPQLFVGTVQRNGDDPRISPAPLAGFVASI